MIKAIETHYNGYRFRSRLEARWAVFFDTAGIKYDYEAQGYTLPSGNYLPDFWLPEQKYFIEIKGEEPTEQEEELASQLADVTGHEVFIFFGDIPDPQTMAHDMYDRGSSYAFTATNILFSDKSVDWRTKGSLDGYLESQKEMKISLFSAETITELFKINQWIGEIRSTSDSRPFVTVKKLKKLLSPLAWEDIDHIANIKEHENWRVELLGGGFDHPYVWGQCFECGKFSIGFSGWDERLACKGGCYICMQIKRNGYWSGLTAADRKKKCPHHNPPQPGCYHQGKQESWASPALFAAYRAARTARFEYGQTPKVLRGKPKK